MKFFTSLSLLCVLGISSCQNNGDSTSDETEKKPKQSPITYTVTPSSKGSSTTSKPTLTSEVELTKAFPSASMKKLLEETELNESNENIDIYLINPTEVLDLEKIKDPDYSATHYPEIYYLACKKHPDSGYAALKAAVSLAGTESNYQEEIDSLVTVAFYLSINDFSIWRRLSTEEKKALYPYLDSLQPIDWASEKDKYK